MNKIEKFANYSHIIFDLDGTLVNSSSSILAALRKAIKKAGIERNDLDESLIGPKLEDILLKLHINDKEVRENITHYFRETYDDDPITGVQVYTQICDLLPALSTKKLFIATNKPEIPTEKILNHYGLIKYFDLVSCSNSQGISWTKAQMVENIIKINDIAKSKCLMVGDTKSDYLAAVSNHIDFAFVNWGYSTEKDYLSKQACFTMD